MKAVRIAVAGSVAAVSVAAFSGPVDAQSPRLQGWWASTNPGGLPVAPSTAPDVPADGLFVQAGPSGPSAYAALTYDLETGMTADTLTLELAPGALPSSPPTLALCALKQASFSAEQGGPMGNAPAYDCKRTASATLDGTSFVFKVAGLVTDGMLAVAVVPGDASTRTALAHPGEDSLTVSGGSSGGSAVIGTTVPPASDIGSGTATSGEGAAAPPALPGLTGTVAAPSDAGAVAPQVAAGAGQAPVAAAPAGPTTLTGATPVAATRSDGTLRRVLLVLVVAVLAGAAAVWAFVGSGPIAEEATA